MNSNLPSTGAANEKLTQNAVKWWSEMAIIHNINLTGFDPEAPLEKRIAWAIANALEIGAIYSRSNTAQQHSTNSQVHENIRWAAKNRIYVPPEFISVDQGLRGNNRRRIGLERTIVILRERAATVLLVYEASRLFRDAVNSYQFFNQEVMEMGLRAVSVSQDIDTHDRLRWNVFHYLTR